MAARASWRDWASCCSSLVLDLSEPFLSASVLELVDEDVDSSEVVGKTEVAWSGTDRDAAEGSSSLAGGLA